MTVLPLELTAPQRTAVEEGVKSGLKDPLSASFGTMLAGTRIRDGQMETIVCGYVNAKNSFGGFTGHKPFVGHLLATGQFRVVAMGDGTGNASLLVGGACRTAGLPILDHPA